MNLENFRWDLFTSGQSDIIRTLIKQGHYNEITAAVRVETPEQEEVLEELLEELRPISAPVDSKVTSELEMALAKDPTNQVLNTPEKEAEWQAKIDAEKKSNEEKVKTIRQTKKAKKLTK